MKQPRASEVSLTNLLFCSAILQSGTGWRNPLGAACAPGLLVLTGLRRPPSPAAALPAPTPGRAFAEWQSPRRGPARTRGPRRGSRDGASHACARSYAQPFSPPWLRSHSALRDSTSTRSSAAAPPAPQGLTVRAARRRAYLARMAPSRTLMATQLARPVAPAPLRRRPARRAHSAARAHSRTAQFQRHASHVRPAPSAGLGHRSANRVQPATTPPLRVPRRARLARQDRTAGAGRWYALCAPPGQPPREEAPRARPARAASTRPPPRPCVRQRVPRVRGAFLHGQWRAPRLQHRPQLALPRPQCS